MEDDVGLLIYDNILFLYINFSVVIKIEDVLLFVTGICIKPFRRRVDIKLYIKHI